MRRITAIAVCSLFVVVGWSRRAEAGITASSTISSQQLGPNSYQYSLSLTNTGTTPIGTFWFGWVPGYDLLPNAPTSVSSPAGWSGGEVADYYGVGSVQWVTTSSPLQPGHTLSSFEFTSPDAPSALEGTSFGLPVKYSYVYIGAPETDPGFLLTAQTASVPEPASLFSLAAGAALVLCRPRRSAI